MAAKIRKGDKAQVIAGAKVPEDILGLRGTTPIDPKVKN